MKLNYQEILQKIHGIYESLDTYLDDYMDQHTERDVPFSTFGLGYNIGGYTFEYLEGHISLSIDEDGISYSLPDPYEDDYMRGFIPFTLLEHFEVKEFADPIIKKYIEETNYLEKVRKETKGEYFYFPDSIEIPYKKNYLELLDKGTIIYVDGKNPAALFEGIYGVPPIKVEDIKKVDPVIHKKVYLLSSGTVNDIIYYIR